MQKTLFKAASVVLFPFYSLVGAVLYGQAITGNVFRDFNANGTKDNSATFNEVGVGGVTVKCTDSSGGTGTTTTSTTVATLGNYSLTGCTGATRVEFSGFLTGDYSGPLGTGSNTSVQFVNATRSGIDFGVNYPYEYTGSANPHLVVSTYVAGSISGSGNINPALIGFRYNSNGESHIDHITGAFVGDIGATWGVAYDRLKKIMYVATVAKRHADFGPGGVGAIYRVDYTNPASPVVLSSFNLSMLVPTIASPRTASSFDPGPYSSYDPEIFDLVGKMGFGDIDISEDGSLLYVMNLTDRSVYQIDVSMLPTPLTASQVTRLGTSDALSPGCNNSDYRPWALKVYRGSVYAGVICTGQTSGNRADLAAYIYKWNGTSWVTEFGPIDLTYAKGPTTSPATTTNTIWNVWVDNFFELDGDGDPTSTSSDIGYPQPILSDIEFDVDGSILLGFADRTSNQTGRSNRSTLTSDPNTYSADLGGELLRVCLINGNYVLEGVTNDCTTPLDLGDAVSNRDKGINNQEYYWGDWSAGLSHFETSMGALALMAGSGEVVTTTLVPINARTGGVRWLNNATGASSKVYEIIDLPASAGGFGKAASLGDIELLADPAPIEIGNRVWLDTDNDGIQDAGEAGISGVQVQLLKGTTVLATATTDANGNYIFSNATGTNTASFKYGLTQLMPNMAYTVRFPTTTTVAGTTYNLTTQAAGSNRLIDSNAPANGDVTILATDIPVSGANNHSFDVGYSAVACVINTPTVNTTCNDNGTGSNPADDTFTFTISTTGTGTGANYKVDKTAPAPTATVFASVNYGATSAASSSYPISGGNLTLTLTDNTTSSCTLTNVNVPAPAPCSTPPAGQPDLKLLKTASSSSVNSGQTLTYTITLTNEGTASATGVVIRDVLPAAVTYVSSSASQGSYNNATGLWTVGTVAVGTPLTLTITVTVN